MSEGENVEWWREHLVKFESKRKKSTALGLNLIGGDDNRRGKPTRDSGTPVGSQEAWRSQ